jgi:hypothetical protein
MPGVDAIRRLQREAPMMRILELTTFDTDSDVLPAIGAGATGYLLKDAPVDDLLRAVRTAARREAVLAPTVAGRLMGKVRLAGTAGHPERLRGPNHHPDLICQPLLSLGGEIGDPLDRAVVGFGGIEGRAVADTGARRRGADRPRCRYDRGGCRNGTTAENRSRHACRS